MESGWERRTETPRIGLDSLRRALRRSGLDRPLRAARALQGGLVNAHWLLHLEAPRERAVFRVHLREDAAAAKEAAVLQHVRACLPVPQVLASGRVGVPGPEGGSERPWLLLTYLDGRPLSAVASGLTPVAQARAGRQVGTALARLHGHARAELGFLDANLRVAEPMPGLRTTWEGYLRRTLFGARAQTRLGSSRRDALRALVRAQTEHLAPLEDRYALLHADCKPTNVLVRADGSLSGLIDWEFAWSGPPLFDLGQMLRWPLPPEFETGLLAGYPAAGGRLPSGWRRAARLLDLMNLAGFLDQPQAGPRQTRDVLKLVDALLKSAAGEGGGT